MESPTGYYAVSPVDAGDITAGKRYPVLSFSNDRDRVIFSLFKGCSYINGQNWKIGKCTEGRE